MAERRTGPFNSQPRHGSDQRAVRAVPAHLRNLHQGYADKAALRELIQRSHEARHKETRQGFGNTELPAYKHKQEIVDVVEGYKASILGGATGSGKSTQVPQFLYEAGYDKIYVMVPRRVIADGLYDRLREEMAVHIPEEELDAAIGVMHGERNDTHDNNRIVIMTPNTFVRAGSDIEAQHADKKVAIIADEMHEANVYTEIAAGVGLKSVQEHENWRFVAMSATQNEAVLQQPLSQVNQGIVPSIHIEGRPFELEWDENPEQFVWDAYTQECEDVAKSMIFTSGKKEIDHVIEQTRNALEAREPGSSQKVVFRKLHGELTEREISHINDPVPDGYRLVIVSSPAGMSGITIPGVTHVISDGTINRSELDDDDVSGLRRNYLSKAGIIQQFGRAGRDVPGGKGILVRPTMVEEDKIRAQGNEVEIEAMPYQSFEEREEFEPPEIYSANLSEIVLSVANLGMSFAEINEYLPHKVAQSEIIKAEQNLLRLGAIDTDGKITSTGKEMSKFPIRPELSRGLVEAMKQKRPLLHMARLALIVSAVGAGGTQEFRQKDATAWKNLLRDTTTDDMIAQLDIMTATVGRDEGGRILADVDFDESGGGFLRGYDLSYKKIKQSQKVARKVLRTFGVNPRNIVHSAPTSDEEMLLREDIAVGMLDFVYKRKNAVPDRYGKTYYSNIHASGDETKARFLSARSVTSPAPEMLVGFPRWFMSRGRKGDVKHEVIEQTMPVTTEMIGRYALAADLVRMVHTGARVEGDAIVERTQAMFGSIAVGDPVSSNEKLFVISENAQQMMIEQVLQHQGSAQRALREVANELALYTRAIPPNVLASYVRDDAPEFVTDESIEKLLRVYAERTTSISHVDQLLREHIYQKNIGIERYLTNEDREYLQKCSPQQVEFPGGGMVKVYNRDSAARTPFITLPPRMLARIGQLKRMHTAGGLTLPDGREILIQRKDSFISAAQL